MPSARSNEKKITNETTYTQKDTKNAQSFCLSGSPKGRGQRPPISFKIMTPSWFSPTPPRDKRSKVLPNRLSPRPDFACYIWGALTDFFFSKSDIFRLPRTLKMKIKTQ